MKNWIFFICIISSNLQLFSQDIFFWSGALTPNSIRINTFIEQSIESIKIHYATKNDFTNKETSANIKPLNYIAQFELKNLTPNTTYYYKFEIDGKILESKENQGKFTTPSNQPFSYQFVVGSCNFFPNNDVYIKMLKQNPLFYIMSGDMHYANPSSGNPTQHLTPYIERVLSQEKEAKFFAQTPFAYVWDDHDFCGDNNESTENCGIAAKKAYVDFVPYYPIQASENTNGIYQSFIIGRVKYILSDLRSERITGDIMSKEQLDWLKNEILLSQKNNQLVAWISTVSFSGSLKDNWGGFTKTREIISNFLYENKIENLFIISGDAHMIAVDNGTNSDFSTLKNNPFKYPILQSAGLNNIGSDKGGTYSEGGTFPNPPFTSQWTKVDVIDNNENLIGVRFTCYRWNYAIKTQNILVDYIFVRNLTGEKKIIPSSFIIDQKKLIIDRKWDDIEELKIIDYIGNVYYKSNCNQNNSSIVIENNKTVIYNISLQPNRYYCIIKTKQLQDIIEIQI